MPDTSVLLSVEPDTLLDSSSKALVESEIDSKTTIDTSFSIQKSSNTGGKRPKKIKSGSRTVPGRESRERIEPPIRGCYKLTGIPLNHTEAVECSQHHWRISSSLLNGGVLDSAREHCRKAISLFENASLFSLKARILIEQEKYSEAVQASEVSIDRNDHWDPFDMEIAHDVRCRALRSLHRMYPSTELLNRVKAAEHQLQTYRSLR